MIVSGFLRVSLEIFTFGRMSDWIFSGTVSRGWGWGVETPTACPKHLSEAHVLSIIHIKARFLWRSAASRQTRASRTCRKVSAAPGLHSPHLPEAEGVLRQKGSLAAGRRKCPSSLEKKHCSHSGSSNIKLNQIFLH